MDILIAGAGIGGLTTALSLSSAGFDTIRIVEAAPKIRPLGVGLNILPNAVRELTELGLFDELNSSAIQTRELALFNRYGSLIWNEPRGLDAGYNWPQFSIHRAHLQTVLAKAARLRLGADVITTDARVAGVTSPPNGRVQVLLEHPTTRTTSLTETDLLIGADGIHSGVRAALYPTEGAPPCNGMVLWRGITWGKPYLSGKSMIVTGDLTHRIVLYPIASSATSGKEVLINWVAARPDDDDLPPRGDWNRQARLAKVLQHFGDWRFDWLDIPGIISGATEIYEYPMVDRDPLPRWTFGRVTLLGDAAHAMYPVGSNGATQAIVDARVLAHALATHHDVEEALVAYERERRPAMAQIQLRNRQMGPEIVINMAHERAPHGFDDIHDVIPENELVEISRRYAETGGFDPETVNTRPSLSLCR